MNEEAASLLGRIPSECCRLPCYHVIEAIRPDGRRYCSPSCPLKRVARRHGKTSTIRVGVQDAAGRRRWIHLLGISVPRSGRRVPWIVHCAEHIEPYDETAAAQGSERFLRQLAARSPHLDARRSIETPRDALTPREREVLDLLIRDRTLRSIAAHLGISYATVRNHVQHILSKLGVHSILEAIAYCLTEEDLPDRVARNRPARGPTNTRTARPSQFS
ncbi:MAG: hypothetical protein KC729_00455 [Candidatus Eisenbacteria bacterium]|uniref:HTH luxR-type domain-containing protein n=1 Tax=Eiseniibacteriota bacterium TaxID=2212470 RepID=A0A956LVK5_UNCEI|nr:hypothetical protein [Candidatus Eisenbacteria bacterium]